MTNTPPVPHVEVISARKYYGPHATGYVLLVNGQVHLHGPLRELKQSSYWRIK